MCKLKNFKINIISKDWHVDTLDFKIDLLLLVAWSGRKKEDVMKHIEEGEKIGIPAPKRIPALYPVSTYLLDTYNEIEVQTQYTSGEVEYVLFVDEDIRYITVGSDHTDRDLEKIDIRKSKQMYPKIIAPIAWKYEDVKDHWDDLILISKQWINGKEIIYQNASLRTLITPDDLLKIVDEFKIPRKNLIIFSGTVATVTGKIMFGEKFRMEMIDPILDRRISYEYRIRQLPQTN